MGQFFKSSKADKHVHIVYVRDVPPNPQAIDPQTGAPLPPAPPQVFVAEEDGHTHEVEFLPDGSFRLLPDPVDGHAHEFTEPHNPKPKQKKEKPEDTVNRVLALFKTAYEYEAESIKRGRESEQFYAGEQWEKAIRDELENQGRACLTFNEIEKHVDDLIGYQSQQSNDLRFFPTEGGDQRVADILNVLSKVILNNTNYKQERSLVFEDQAIAGRGSFNMFVDFSNDIQGDIKVERFPWDQVVYGPHEKLDGSDREYQVKYLMESLGRLKKRHKKLANELDEAFIKLADTRNTNAHTQYQTDQYARSDNSTPVILSAIGSQVTMVDTALKDIMVFELQEKCIEDVAIIVDAIEGSHTNAVAWKEAELKQVESLTDQAGLHVVETKRPYLRITKVAGDVLLSDENPADVPKHDFYVIPVYGKKKKNSFWGLVQSAKDPQREINKRASQAIDIGNRMASYGWFIDEMTFNTKEELEQFKQNAGRPGFVQKISALERPPHQVEGIKFPGEIVNLMQLSEDRLRSYISVSATEKAGANTSSAAILQAEKSQLVGRQRFFDNLSAATLQIGRLLIGLIRRYYSPERIFRIVASQAMKAPPGAPMQVGAQNFGDYTMEEIVELLRNDDLDRYDVQVGEAQWSPTQRLATLQVLTDLVTKGAPIPFEILAEYLDTPEDVKQKLIQGIMQQQQMQQSTEGAKGEAEVQKALIAKGLFPPKVLEAQGINPASIPPPQVTMDQNQPPQPQGPYINGPAGLTS